ncbi:MAG TPA: RlmE family RNA methyltransferase [Candidatus Peribacteria bacterium]|nr:RlmE family RNA methyltransferase [Candidatus Peribacteria bacterium]
MPKPYQPNDKWSQRAAREGYRARSVFKLEELDHKFHLLEHGQRVLDIGAAPGSWLQYASKMVGPTGKVIGLDLTPIKHVAPNVVTYVADVFDFKQMGGIISGEGWDKVDLILSDLAPNTTGIRDVDQWRSIELNQQVVAIAQRWLRRGGTVVMKVFRGADFDEFTQLCKRTFPRFKLLTVQASRDRSREVYVLCG